MDDNDKIKVIPVGENILIPGKEISQNVKGTIVRGPDGKAKLQLKIPDGVPYKIFDRDGNEKSVLHNPSSANTNATRVDEPPEEPHCQDSQEQES